MFETFGIDVVIAGLVGNQNDSVRTLNFANQSLHIGVYMDAIAVGNQLGVDSVVIVDGFIHANATTLGVLGQVAGCVGVVGANA